MRRRNVFAEHCFVTVGNEAWFQGTGRLALLPSTIDVRPPRIPAYARKAAIGVGKPTD